MGTKIKCLQCGDIVEGDRLGHCLSCSCGACYIDETPYYYRIGGDYSKVALIDEEGNEKILKETVPTEQLVIDIPTITKREWMLKKSDEELADFIINDLPYIYQSYTDSVVGLAKWFKELIKEE